MPYDDDKGLFGNNITIVTVNIIDQLQNSSFRV